MSKQMVLGYFVWLVLRSGTRAACSTGLISTLVRPKNGIRPCRDERCGWGICQVRRLFGFWFNQCDSLHRWVQQDCWCFIVGVCTWVGGSAAAIFDRFLYSNSPNSQPIWPSCESPCHLKCLFCPSIMLLWMWDESTTVLLAMIGSGLVPTAWWRSQQ